MSGRTPVPSGAIAAFVLGLLVASAAHAQWIPSGVPVCIYPGEQDYPVTATDGAGGAFIVWRDFRLYGDDADLYAHHITASGTPAPGWPFGGAPVCTALFSPADHVVTPDGLGGVIIAWEDQRDVYTTGVDIYALRMLADGELAPGWPQDGLAVCQAAEDQRFPSLVADGVGGGLIAWTDYRDGSGFYNINPDVYAVRVTADGKVAAGWLVGGTPVAATLGDEIFPQLVPSGDGAAIVVYQAGVSGGDIYAQRLMRDGTTDPAWPPSGVVLCAARDYQVLDAVSGDGAGGAFAAWRDYRSYPGIGVSFPWLDIYAQHVTADGHVASGWPPNGLAACTAPGGQLGARMVPDGSGGFLAAWNDYRSGAGAIYAQRVPGSGQIAPGWPTDGRLVSTLAGAEYKASIAEDGSGGAYIAFENETNSGPWKVHAQHLTGTGGIAPGWAEQGAPVSTGPGYGFDPSIVRSGSGAIVAWDDYDIFAQKLVTDGPVPTLVSLVSVEARADEVELRWYAAGGLGGPATVNRETAGGGWQDLAAVYGDGTGNIAYRDRAVIPGTRYGYRLSYLTDGKRVTSAETWVDVPLGLRLRLSLEGFRPNPAVGEPVLAFGLANGQPASLELFDASGRRLLAEEVGPLGAGTHAMRLGPRSLAPGVYWLRLQQGAQSLMRRGVVVR